MSHSVDIEEQSLIEVQQPNHAPRNKIEHCDICKGVLICVLGLFIVILLLIRI